MSGALLARTGLRDRNRCASGCRIKAVRIFVMWNICDVQTGTARPIGTFRGVVSHMSFTDFL